jgi:hypothetical protein
MNTQTRSISLTVAGLAVAAVFAYTIPNTYAQFTNQISSQNNSAAAGTVDVKLVDVDGNTSSTPVINITNAQPAMANQNSTIRIANTGTLAADIRLYVTNLTASASNLNDVLDITIKDQQGNTLYSGAIADLDLNFEAVSAGLTKELAVAVSWPDLVAVDDNPYQGATLSFEFAVDSASVSA